MTMEEMIAQAETDLLHTYNRYQIVLDHGDGVYLYDVNGKKYLDFVAGIAVFAFGYNKKGPAWTGSSLPTAAPSPTRVP